MFVYLLGCKSKFVTSLYLFDYAYLILAGLILFFKLNEPKYVVNSRNITILMSALFIAFIFFYNAGSRAAILAVFVYLVLYPASFINAYAPVISFPSVKFLIIFALLALLLFYRAYPAFKFLVWYRG